MKADLYITSTGNISPQNTFGKIALPEELVEYNSVRLTCVEPEYKSFIDPKMIRRMSRIIRMGVAASSSCLQQAGVKMPGAIVTGTAYGCLEDTGVFLTKMVEQNEQLLTPTAFIQSTHNTIGAQIALLLGCNGYNNAFVHRGFSFESALLDACLLIKENEAENVLVGAIDELTDSSFSILQRFGLYKREPVSSLDLYKEKSKGTIAGEGASFFLLSAKATGNDFAKLDGFTSFYKPKGIAEIKEQINSFLASQSVSVNDIDLLITGRNGDSTGDKIYRDLQSSVFSDIMSINYKNLCGEYPTSTAFALWLAAGIVKNGKIPSSVEKENAQQGKIKTILVYNHYENIHHSLFLISAC